MEAKDRIIVALDVPTLEKAKELAGQLAPYVGMFKVGLQLITAEGGPRVVREISKLGGKVMYDGKFHDTPNTIAEATSALPKGIRMFTVHASGGVEMMMAAIENSQGACVLAVTILTSLSEEDAHLIYGSPSKAKVLELARWASLADVDGIVCSPKELEILGSLELKDFWTVTPGIRPEWAVKGDQKRITTPAKAIELGADYLVIGRPITQPPAEIGSPADAAKKITEEIADVA